MNAILIGALLAFTPMQQTDTTFAAGSATELRLDNMSGTTVVRGWDRAQVRIRARHTTRTSIDVRRSGSSLRVEGERQYGPAVGVDYEIDVPAGMNLNIDGVHNSADISGVNGAISVESVNGSITVVGGRGAIRLESVEGRVALSNAEGNIRVTTVNESVSVTNSSGDIHAETVNGGISMTGIRSSNVNASTVNGNVQYTGTIRDGGEYYVNTHNGSITLTIPSATNATVVVATHHGEFEVDFPVQVRDREARGRFEFRLGNGSARVELESFGGSIRLRRAN